jgi:hypothetical protein
MPEAETLHKFIFRANFVILQTGKILSSVFKLSVKSERPLSYRKLCLPQLKEMMSNLAQQHLSFAKL